MTQLKKDILGYIQRYLHILVWYDDCPRNLFSDMENILNKSEIEAYHHTIDILYLLIKLNLITHKEYKNVLSIEKWIEDLISTYKFNGNLITDGWSDYFYPTESCRRLIKWLPKDLKFK
ncbi:hypothetical protein [Histophilus somni]|uniref:hypothetical protein n=1 Tax=Histophilus somni TaxID=731 RepID=UPI00201ECAA6|nr:hypothetical protein [Histophilus somni]